MGEIAPVDSSVCCSAISASVKPVFLKRQLLGKEIPSHRSFADDQPAVNGMQLVNVSVGDSRRLDADLRP